MKMTAVESSNIAEVGYDQLNKVLHIKFKHGGLYAYYGVDPQTAHKLVHAKSVGGYFISHIKNEYDYDRLDTRENEQDESHDKDGV